MFTGCEVSGGGGGGNGSGDASSGTGSTSTSRRRVFEKTFDVRGCTVERVQGRRTLRIIGSDAVAAGLAWRNSGAGGKFASKAKGGSSKGGAVVSSHAMVCDD